MYCVKADRFIDVQESNGFFFISEEEFGRFRQSELKAFVEGLVDSFPLGDVVVKKIFGFYEQFIKEAKEGNE